MTITVVNMLEPTALTTAAAAVSTSLYATVLARSTAMGAMFVGDDPNQFRLVIDGIPVQEVKSATLFKSIDSAADGFTAVIPAFEELAAIRDFTLAPPNYPIAQVYLGGRLRFTGKLYERKCKFGKSGKYRTLIGWSPIVDAIDSVVTPPYELNMMTLASYATAQLAPFGLAPIWLAGVDPPFTRIKADRDTSVGEQLFKLARQRGVFLMSDEFGSPTFYQPIAADPVAYFVEGIPPFDEAELSMDGRKWFGQHVCFSKAPRGNKQATALDDRFPVCRRRVVTAPEGSDADMKTAAEWAARKSFADGLEFSQPVQGWYPSPLPMSDIWLPNTLVRVTSPTLFLRTGFDFLIRSVEYRWDANDGARATLDLVSPTAYQTLLTQKQNLLSWKARLMLGAATATPLEQTLMDVGSPL